MSSVDISGLNKVELLERLWNCSRPAAFFAMTGLRSPDFGSEGPSPSVAVRKFIDYYCGRVIKTDLSKDFVDPFLYDRDNGTGAFAGVVAKMRTGSS